MNSIKSLSPIKEEQRRSVKKQHMHTPNRENRLAQVSRTDLAVCAGHRSHLDKALHSPTLHQLPSIGKHAPTAVPTISNVADMPPTCLEDAMPDKSTPTAVPAIGKVPVTESATESSPFKQDHTPTAVPAINQVAAMPLTRLEEESEVMLPIMESGGKSA